MRTSKALPVSAALLILSLSACAAPKIKTTKLVPAKSGDAAALKTVAVLPFDGTGGAMFATEVEATLASVNINDKQYFAVIERKSLDKVMQEMKLGQSGLIDPATAANIGNVVGAKGIYLGTVTDSRATDSPFKAERSKCSQYATRVDKKGRSSQECVQWSNYHVNCTKREALFSFAPKLVAVESSRIVYANPIQGTSSAEWCEDSTSERPAHSQLIDSARDQAKALFRQDIAPHYVTVEIQMMDSKDGIDSAEAKDKLGKGLDFAKAGRMDRACELWGEARIAAERSPALLYDLGICAEITGNPEQALDLYKKADRELGKPNDQLTMALKRVGQDLKDREKLSKQVAD